MDYEEEQQGELEVLESIYEGELEGIVIVRVQGSGSCEI